MKFLRLFLLTYAFICLLGGIALYLHQKSVGNLFIFIYLFINSTLIIVGSLFEKRYKSKKVSKTGWQRTSERFIDPKNGKLVEVHFNAKTGERNYRESDSKQ